MYRVIFYNGCYHKLSKKNITVSIRLSEEIYDVIMNYRGKNFSNKFENLVVDYISSLENPEQKM